MEKPVLLVLTGDSSYPSRKTYLVEHLGELLQWPLIDVEDLYMGFYKFFPFDTAKPRHEYIQGYYRTISNLAYTQLRIKLNVIISAPFIDKDDFVQLGRLESYFGCRLTFIDVDQLSESDLDFIKEKDVSTVRRFIESYLPDPLNIARNLQEPPPDGEPLLRICARLDEEEKKELEEEEEEQEVEKEEKKGGSSCLLCCKPINNSIYSVPMHNKCAKLAVKQYYPDPFKYKEEKQNEEVEERFHKYNDISCRPCLGPFKLGQPVVKEEGPNYIIPGRLMHESCADSPVQLNIPTHDHPVSLSYPP